MGLHQPATDPMQRLAERISNIETTLSQIQARGIRVATGSGAPTVAAPDGTLYIRTDTTAAYFRVNGTWKSVAIS